MKYFTPQDVVEAWKRGEINRFKVRMNRKHSATLWLSRA